MYNKYDSYDADWYLLGRRFREFVISFVVIRILIWYLEARFNGTPSSTTFPRVVHRSPKLGVSIPKVSWAIVHFLSCHSSQMLSQLAAVAQSSGVVLPTHVPIEKVIYIVSCIGTIGGFPGLRLQSEFLKTPSVMKQHY